MRMEKRSLALIAMVAAGFGCGKGGGATIDAGDLAALQAAESPWAAAKSTCPDYHYAALASSVFGSRSTTTIEIADDQPVERSFVGYPYSGAQGDAGAEAWDEVGAAQIGTHTDGAMALTVEQLFAACQASLAQNSSQNTLTLTIGTDGVPTACGYTPNNCVDDCYTGFRLSDFTCAPWPGDAAAGD
jgi:hypothetical protein